MRLTLLVEVSAKLSSTPLDGDSEKEGFEEDDEEKELPLLAGNGVDSSFLLRPDTIVLVVLACLLYSFPDFIFDFKKFLFNIED